ncbi:MAG: hypothetical protein AAGD23_11565 [Pseudomonadota bacterium]
MPDLSVIFQHFLVAGVGFAAAGAAASVYNMVLHRPVRFERAPDSRLGRLMHVLLLMFAGPLVLARNSFRARRIENRAVGWVAASGAIAATWCLMSGLFILSMLRSASAALL